MEKSRVDLAVQKHEKGYNCCQAVACAYCDLFGMEEEEAFRVTEALGFGLSGLQETCGAVTAMMILAGLKNSDGNLDKPASKRGTYALGKQMADIFQEWNTSILCRELKGKKLRSCSGCIADAARLTEEILFPDKFDSCSTEE